MRRQVCDGTWVSWESEWVDNECRTCGHVDGKIDIAEPPFHGKREWRDRNREGLGSDLVCTRCGGVLPDLEKVNHFAGVALSS